MVQIAVDPSLLCSFENADLNGRFLWQALAAVFMMNNLHYIVKTVESSEVLTVLGEEWIEQHKDQVPFVCPLACERMPLVLLHTLQVSS